MVSKGLNDYIEARRRDFEAISDKVWALAEMRYQEFGSAALQQEFLTGEGFRVTGSIGGIKTAFVAEYGSGRPVVAVCGEYDALPGLSQKADEASHCPLEEGKPGHGCGHNLLGTAAMEAAVAVAHQMKEEGLGGTVRYYGCPAEESGAGKAFMVRGGCFSDVDIALTWHPSTLNCLWNNSLANARVIYEFTGVSSHAAGAPHMGRSALDAAELMNVGANFLREHIIPEARLHYAFLDCGGEAPNIVQATGKLIYAIRAPKFTQVGEIMERVNNIARGAALMTGTSVRISIVSAYANLMPNDTLDDLMLENAKAVFPLKYTEEELAYAARFSREAVPLEANFIPVKKLPPSSSTDFGDVSWVVPSASAAINCFAKGTALHTWNVTAQGKSRIAYHGMHTAATILAATALDVLRDPAKASKAKQDLEKTLGGETYRSLIPEDVPPGAF